MNMVTGRVKANSGPNLDEYKIVFAQIETSFLVFFVDSNSHDALFYFVFYVHSSRNHRHMTCKILQMRKRCNQYRENAEQDQYQVECGSSQVLYSS